MILNFISEFSFSSSSSSSFGAVFNSFLQTDGREKNSFSMIFFSSPSQLGEEKYLPKKKEEKKKIHHRHQRKDAAAHAHIYRRGFDPPTLHIRIYSCVCVCLLYPIDQQKKAASLHFVFKFISIFIFFFRVTQTPFATVG